MGDKGIDVTKTTTRVLIWENRHFSEKEDIETFYTGEKLEKYDTVLVLSQDGELKLALVIGFDPEEKMKRRNYIYMCKTDYDLTHHYKAELTKVIKQTKSAIDDKIVKNMESKRYEKWAERDDDISENYTQLKKMQTVLEEL